MSLIQIRTLEVVIYKLMINATPFMQKIVFNLLKETPPPLLSEGQQFTPGLQVFSARLYCPDINLDVESGIKQSNQIIVNVKPFVEFLFKLYV